jgi:hypothetical protein
MSDISISTKALAERIIQRYDLNNDQKIDSSEQQAVSDVLAPGSRFGLRNIDKTDLSSLFNEFKGPVSKAALVAFFDKEYDKTKDHRLNQSEIGNLAQDYPEVIKNVGNYLTSPIADTSFNSGSKEPATKDFEIRQNQSVYTITNPNPPTTINVNQNIRKLN